MADSTIAWLTSWTPTTDDLIVFYDNADSTTKKAAISTLPVWAWDMVLASTQINSGLKTFLDATFGLRNVANTFTSFFTNTITASRTYTLKDASWTLAFTTDITGINSGINTGDETTWRINTLYGTSNAITVGSVELWHATDTTLSRVSAGVIAVEWVNVVTTALTWSTTQAGIAEASISSEVNTGTDANRYVSPDSLAGSNLGIRYVACSLNGTTALTTSDKAYFRIPSAITGMNLVSVSATVGTGASGSSSSGVPTFTVKNVTDGNQMLSTSLTVDASEYTSATASTPAVINASFDDVVTDDLIEVACTVAGTGVTYATILVWFQLP